MEEKVVRSTRMRLKPLQYWNNERIHYNLVGEVFAIDAPLSSVTLPKNSISTKTVTSQPSSARMTQSKRGLVHKVNTFASQDPSFQSCQIISKSLENSKVLRETAKSPQKEVDLSKCVKNSRKTYTSEGENVGTHKEPKIQKSKTTSKRTVSRLQSQTQPVVTLDTVQRERKIKNATFLSEKPPETSTCIDDDGESLTNTAIFSQRRKRISSKMNEKYSGKNVEELQIIPEEIEDCDNGDKNNNEDYDKYDDYSNCQNPVDISQLQFLEQDRCIFQLKSMYKVINEHNETFYMEKGPLHSQFGLITGFIFVASPTLHWGRITSSREIFVIDGEGTIEFVEEKTAVKHSKPLFKGVTYDINSGGDVVLRKDEKSSFLKLFVVFTSSNSS